MNKPELQFSLVAGRYAICRLPPGAPIPARSGDGDFYSVTHTADEVSVVCSAERLPAGAEVNAAWSCFKIAGPIPFEQIGVLAAFIAPLSARGISIFAISTFDTDYVLVREPFAEQAMAALKEAGHKLVPETTSRV
jgi:hypothetical protein